MKRVLAVWLPNWPLQRLLRKNPALVGRPVTLKHRTQRGECVAACSVEAYARGARVAMPIAEALALGGKQDGWHHAEHDRAADREALVRLAQWCHRFSPTIGLEDVTACDLPWPETLLLDATNLGPLFGSEAAWVDQVQRGFEQLQLRTRITLADNIAVAWAATHYSDASPVENNPAKPRPLIVPPGVAAGPLASLPVEALRLPPATVQLLVRLGVVEVDQLLALPRDQLRSRFGQELLLRIDQALGRIDEVIEATPPPAEFIVDQQLEHPVAKREHVEHIVDQLIQRLAHLLTAQNVGALQMACRFDCQSGAPAILQAGWFRPAHRAEHLLEIVQMHLERLLLPGAVTGIQLRVVQHAPLERRQRVLFDAEASLDKSWQLAALVDRLTGRLGRQAVVRSRLHHDAQPELAYREEPLIGGKRSKAATSKRRRQPTRPGALDRPLQLLERPAALDGFAAQRDPPQAGPSSGPPQHFHYAGRQYHVARSWGPERIETGWWRKRSVSRDYYRVETTDGQRFWLYRCLRSRKWFLQGIFA